MAVFTAIASAIVGAIGISTATIIGTVTWASLATSIIATGLAVGTAKIMGVFKPPASTSGQDPGVKVQLGPSTDNKVPRLYGRNFTGGIIIDAEIKNSNKTMAYALVIGEYNTNDTWTINTIYRGDQELNFGSGANAHQVISVTDPNATSSTSIANKFRVRVYAGNSESTSQIFPVPGGSVTAVDAYGAGSCQFSNWTSANTMEDLVFAVVEMDYDAENDLVGLGAITFDINNALNEPSNVLLDYLRNSRYGAGISNTMIDTTSFNDWFTYADANVDYINSSNTTVQHSRYQIDGALNTFTPVIDNVNKICQAGGAFFTYNAKQGKFGVVVNRPASNAELASAFVFDDDNITSSITITSTELYSLYNQIEVEYPSVNQRDQTDLYFAECNASIRNSNEPDNCLKYRLDMVNDRSRVAQLANIDLNQSRINTILEFTADFSSMTVDVGDVVKVTLPLYGYNEKLFRAMRVIEQEDPDGMIHCKFTLLEYDADVYDDLLTQEDLPLPVTGITNWWVTNSNAVLTIGNITIVNDPTSANAQQYYPANGTFAGNIAISNVSANFGAVFANTTFINVPIKPPVNTNFNLARVAVVDDSGANSAPVYYTQSPSSTSTYFTDDEFFNFPISTNAFKRDLPFYLEIQTQDTLTGAASRVYTTAQLNVDRSNTVSVVDVATFGAGGQFLAAGVSNTSVASGTTYLKISPEPDLYYEIRGSDPGIYILDAAVTPGGALTGNTYSIGMRSNAKVWFSNTTSNISVSFYGGGAEYINISSGAGIVPQIVDNQEVITDTGLLANVFPGQVYDDMSASNVTLWLEGFNTLNSSNAAPRAMSDQKINLYKITKSK
jgi:hypothetical protein